MKKRILIIQTAFIGDVILTLPVVQVLKDNMDCEIDFLCIPKVSGILETNEYIDNLFLYDKKHRDKGFVKFRRLARRIKNIRYDIILSPHRSLRSSLLSKIGNSDVSISFDSSSLSFLYDKKVPYKKDIHEIMRNLKLLEPLGIYIDDIIKPKIFITEGDEKVVNLVLKKYGIYETGNLISVAPGSVWMTKRLPPHKIIKILDYLKNDNIRICLIGGKEDSELCKFIIDKTKNKNVFSTAGKLTLLQSACLIHKSAVLLTNDSSPLHIGNAVDTKVLAVFGSTIPEFGFYPIGDRDIVYQVKGLKCRPCSIHGKQKCPLGTLECLEKIDEKEISSEIVKTISSSALQVNV